MGASERLYHSQGRECGLGGLPGKRSRDAFPVTPYHTLIIPKRHILDYFGLKHRKCMFDNVQTLSVGMDMLFIGLAPLIALGLERYCREGDEHGSSDYTACAGEGRPDCGRDRSGCRPLYQWRCSCRLAGIGSE